MPAGVGASAAARLGGMDLTAVVRSYVERMLREVSGMKVLLLDAETTKIVSTVYSQSEILEQEVGAALPWATAGGQTVLHSRQRNVSKIKRIKSGVNDDAGVPGGAPGCRQRGPAAPHEGVHLREAPCSGLLLDAD